MKLVVPFAAALALAGCGSTTHTVATTSTNPTGMTSSTPTGPTIPAKVTPIHRRGRAFYTIDVLERSTPVTYSWRCGGIGGNGATWRRPCNGTLQVTVTSKRWRCTAASGAQPICLRR
jgi:hypothetical protein